jgi:hypothetical protein
MIAFVTAHWAEILGVLGFVLAAAHIIVKLTPSTKDDEILAKVESALTTLGVKIPEQPK